MKILEPILQPHTTIAVDDVIIPNNSMSGDWIDGGTITNFKSEGIKDQSKDVKLFLNDDKIELRSNLEGRDATLQNVKANHVSSPEVAAYNVRAENVFVKGHITSDRLVYKKAEADNFDVKKSVRINLREVLWEDRLGNSVIRSALREVGVLDKLQVSDTFSVDGHRVGINTTKPEGCLAVDQGGDQIVLDFVNGKAFIGMHSNSNLDIGNGKQQISITSDGKVGIGVKRPSQALDVDGNVRFNSTTITSDNKSPKEGNWQRGDICYNTEPINGGYVGWSCLRGGTPGTWSPFGLIV